MSSGSDQRDRNAAKRLSEPLMDWLRQFVVCSRKGHNLKELPMEVYCLRCGWHRGREDWL